MIIIEELNIEVMNLLFRMMIPTTSIYFILAIRVLCKRNYYNISIIEFEIEIIEKDRSFDFLYSNLYFYSI